MSLDQAREEARAWHAMLRRGVDPKVEQAKQRAANEQLQATRFSLVAEAFMSEHTSKLAKHKEARRVIESEFVARWGARPVTEIQPAEVTTAIRAIAKRSPAMAHVSLSYLRGLYNWALGTQAYGITASPVDKIRPATVAGKKNARVRVLEDTELKAVWETAISVGYPFGSIVRMLILTGARLREIADLSWSEVDLEKQLLIVPATRMKGKKAHVIPLAPMALGLMQSLPRFRRGDFVFTTLGGAKPFVGFGMAKRRLDEQSGVGLTDNGWVLHDLRRTFRTSLSALPIEDRVREAMVAHAPPAMDKIYNQYLWADEKRRGYQLFEQRFAAIIAPKPPATITDLSAVRRTQRSVLTK
jgi:integrase